MESKNIKVIDEHGIDRDANVICAVDVDGSDYVVYWIERDSENDNIFVSKLIKNIDNTSNMINIEDSMEKSKISDIVKELIKYSIDNESNTLDGKTVSLPSGKSLGIISTLINREQNINVKKTYITTVKKSVTKVSESFYDVKGNEPVVEAVPEVFPVVEPVKKEVVAEVAQPVEPTVPTPVEVPTASPEQIIPLASVQPAVVQPVGEPVIPAVAPVVSNVAPLASTVETPSVTVPTEPVAPTPVPVTPEQVVVAPAPQAVNVVETPVLPVEPTVVSSEPTPVPDTPVDNRMVFDASKESNLNEALGEVSNDGAIAFDNVAPIREFGVDEVKSTPASETVTPVAQEVPTSGVSRKAGFANNKFFMVIAIAFFLASCIFLGYEVFNYFQAIK